MRDFFKAREYLKKAFSGWQSLNKAFPKDRYRYNMLKAYKKLIELYKALGEVSALEEFMSKL